MIIVDSTDPVGPAEGLFNRAFYETCLRALRPDGLLVQQSEIAAGADATDPGHALGACATPASSHFRTLPFPQPCYPTGWWSCTIASKTGARPDRVPRGAMPRRRRSRPKYYNAGVHQGALAMPELLREALGDGG